MYGGNYNNFKGKKYDEVNTGDVPKLVKQYIRKKYPNVEASVRIDNRGSYTTSIDVRFTKLPFIPFTEEYLRWYEVGKTQKFNNERNYEAMYNNRYKNMVEDIEKFASQYNHDYSDTMTDYFDKRFYFFVSIDYDYEKQLLKGNTNKVSKKDIEEKEYKEMADRLTKDNTQSAFFIYKDTSNGRRYYQMGRSWGLIPRPKGLIEFMDKHKYKYTLRKE